MKKSILLAILLCSGSLHAEGDANGAPNFMKIIQRENSLYLGLQGIAYMAGQPDTITYPLVTNIITDEPDASGHSIKGQSIVMTVEINCQSGQGRRYGMRVYSQHFGRGRLIHNFSTEKVEPINLPELYKQPDTSVYLVTSAVACQAVDKPIAGKPEIIQDILSGNRNLSPWP